MQNTQLVPVDRKLFIKRRFRPPIHIESWIKLNGLQRPLLALTEMHSERRDNIRKSLKIEEVEPSHGDPLFESIEIISRRFKGITGRLRSRKESIMSRNLTWRQILTRIIDKHLEIVYRADASEQELEVLICNEFNRTKIKSQMHNSSIPAGAFRGLKGKPRIVIEIARGFDEIFDKVVGSEDKPAIDAVYAICCHLHPELRVNKKEFNGRWNVRILKIVWRKLKRHIKRITNSLVQWFRFKNG